MRLTTFPSVPEISLVESDPVFVEEGEVFLLEGSLPVVFLLFQDVIPDRFDFALADRESAVAGLPGEVLERDVLAFRPKAGTTLHLPDEVARRHGPWQDYQQMHMIRHASRGETFSALFGDESAEIAVHVSEDRGIAEEGFAILRGEDDVDQ